MAVGDSTLLSAGLGMARLKLWNAMSVLFSGRRAVFYSITARRSTNPEDFKSDMAALFDLLRDRAIHPVVIERLPLAAARIIVGESLIVGVSTHSVEQARAAEADGADYIGFGAIYSGGLKNVANAQGLERLRAVRAAVRSRN